jgi:hypothetical protein
MDSVYRCNALPTHPMKRGVSAAPAGNHACQWFSYGTLMMKLA